MPLMASTARSIPRPPTLLAAASVLVALVGSISCAEPARAPDAFIAEHAPFGDSGVATDLMFPVDEGASQFLVRNWPPQQTLEGDSMWVHGRRAVVGFFSAADQPPAFVVEARPYTHPDAPAQTMEVVLNGRPIDRVAMAPAWRSYRFELPADIVEIGWNLIDLRFSQTPRPADFDPESDDRRVLTANFRRLELIAATGRPHWPDRPDAVSVDSPGEIALAAIEMPTDSYLQVELAPGRNTTLTGTVETAFGPADDGVIRTVVEVVGADAPLRVWETELHPGSTNAAIEADLSGWSGQVIGLRLRVFGDVNGIVRWVGTGTHDGDNSR